MRGHRQPSSAQATTSAAFARACTTIQQTAQLALRSGNNALLELSEPAVQRIDEALRMLIAPTPSGGTTAAQSDAATMTAVVQLNSCLLRVVLQLVSRHTASQLQPGPSSPAASGALRTLLLWHKLQGVVASVLQTYLQERPANNSSSAQAADPRCMRRRMAVALLRTDTLQAYCMVMAALLEQALGPDRSTSAPNFRVLTLVSCLAKYTKQALLLARGIFGVAQHDARALACLRRALHASGLLAHACHVLLRLADWRQITCRLPDRQDTLQHVAFDDVLRGSLLEARGLMFDAMSRPELELAALAPAVQYITAAQLVEAAAAVDGGPTNGLRAPGMMRLFERCALVVGFTTHFAMLPAACILAHPLYLLSQRQQQHQRQHQPDILLGASSVAAPAPDQRGDGGLPPALFGPTESFDLLVRGVDCMFREVEAAGQQAAAGSGAPTARGGPSLEQRYAEWPNMVENARSTLTTAAAALDAMPPRQREQRLPHLWRTLSRAIEGAASAGWCNTGVAQLLELAAGRLTAVEAAAAAPAAGDVSPSDGTVNGTVTTVNGTVTTVNSTVHSTVTTVNDTVSGTVNGMATRVDDTAATVNGAVRIVSSEARAAHQQGFVRAWAAALRCIRLITRDGANPMAAMPLVLTTALQVPASWSALREAGALPSELAQVALALRKLVAAEATTVVKAEAGVLSLWWLEAATRLLSEQLAVVELGAAGALPHAGQQPSPGAEPVPGAALGPVRGSGSGASCSPGNAQEQQQQQRQVADRAVIGACAALALLPTLSRRLAALLREQLQPALGCMLHRQAVSCVCDATTTVAAWAQQAVLDGVCGGEPIAPAAGAAADAAAEARLGGFQEPQAPQPSSSGSSAMPPRPEQANVGGVAAASALHPAGGGVPAPPAASGADDAAGWRRFAAHGLALGELAAAGLEWAAAVSAPPGEGPLSKEELDGLGSEAERAAAANAVGGDSCTMLMLLEVVDPGSLNRALAHGGSTGTAGSGIAAPAAGAAGGAAAAAGPSALRASLEALARRKYPSMSVCALLQAAHLLRTTTGNVVRPVIPPMVMAQWEAYSKWLPPLDAAAALLPAACSNPLCASPEGPCEAQGQGHGPQGQALRACGRCGGARYCSRDCQVAHWRAGHKAECEEAQAAAAPAHAAGAAMAPRAAAGLGVERPC